jgi:hypothetical protein
VVKAFKNVRRFFMASSLGRQPRPSTIRRAADGPA